LIKLGLDSSMVLYCEADLQRRPTPQLVADGVEMARQFQPHVFAIEVNQFQQLLAAEFTRVAEAQQVLLPLVELDNQVNKQVRIRRLGTYLSQRRLRFKSCSAGTTLLVQQLQDFPVGDHDDGPDALEQALRVLTDLWNGREQEPDSECTRLVPY
jgi:predicted phage terminase large subunit-like protein